MHNEQSVAISGKITERTGRVSENPTIWVYAHAAPLDRDHTTALSGTLWRHTLRELLARAKFMSEVPL